MEAEHRAVAAGSAWLARVVWSLVLISLLAVGSVLAQDTPDEPDPPEVESPAEPEPTSEGGEPDVPQEEAPPADVRVDTVPEEGEAASSDRIQFRGDPLDIAQETFKSKWDRFLYGLGGITRYSFLDGRLRFRLGLRFQIDGTLVAPSDRLEQDLGEMPEGFDARRFRLFAEGIWGSMYFRAEFDFATDIGFKSAYLEGREGGLAVWDYLLGKFRYGLIQEPFSLENNVSSFDTTFAEVSMPIAAIGPGVNIGAMVYDASPSRKFTWAVGTFTLGQDTEDNASRSLLSLSGRFGYNPTQRNDSETVFHLGASLSTRTPTDDSLRYQARPEARFVRTFADTGDVTSNRVTLYGVDAAWRHRDSWAQVEGIRSNIDTPTGTEHVGGYVVQVGHFLTGMSRPWDDLFGAWGRVRPDRKYSGGNPFKASNGGEWEVAARYSVLDLKDETIDGGEVRNLTVGVNWYPADTWKLQFNWVHSRVEDSGYANIWILRYQFFVR